MQSAYSQGHSTETALLKVCNDILLNIDQQQVTIMALLDLSAAFDTVHHTIFLDRLAKDFGIEGTSLAWMASYHSNRTQQVIVNGVRSERVSLSTSFPQGGGACPWAYSRYIKAVAHIIQLFCILYHFFADDSQLYRSFKTSTTQDQILAFPRALLKKYIPVDVLQPPQVKYGYD